MEELRNIVLALAFVGVVVAAVLGAVRCERLSNDAFVECVKAGRAPLECRVAVGAGVGR